MLYTLTQININKEVRKYKVEFTLTYFNKFSKKDKEKAYRIERIIDSLGEDNIDETSDKDYRFQTDDDNGEHILDGVVNKEGEPNNPSTANTHSSTTMI
jgi:hypothetical protein